MLRSFFIHLSKADWARKLIMGWGLSRRMATRFIAGDTLDDAIRAVEALNEKGINATLDQLGEHTTTPDDARQATQGILDIFDHIAQTGVRANVSIKLTQIGLALDKKLVTENLQKILKRAAELGTFLRIDMEDSPVTQITLDILHQTHAKGFTSVGTVIQSYLYRSEKDIRDLAQACIAVRLCKGAYKEPPTVAFPKKADVDANYDKLAALLMDNAKAKGCQMVSEDGKLPPLTALATHDAKRIQFAKEYAAKIGLDKSAVEFQMLYGIRRDLQEQLVAEGYPVRVYVPYGTQWYPYFMRRLAERPANIWFFLSNLLRR